MLSEAYDRLEAVIATKSEGELKPLREMIAKVDHSDRVSYQDMQAQLHAAGVIDLKDASMVYNALGEGVSQNTWDNLPLTMQVFLCTVLPMIYLKWTDGAK